MLRTNYERIGGQGFWMFNILLSIASIVGYIMNIVAIVHAINNPLTGMFILRVIGIFAFPLGCILGYF